MRFYLLLILLLIAKGPSVSAAVADLRTWTSSDGQYSVRAELVDFNGSTVRLKKTDSTVVKLPASQLSKDDQAFLAKWKQATPNAPATADATSPPGKDRSAERSAKAALAKLGIRVSGTKLALTDEVKLARDLRNTKAPLKTLKGTEQNLVEQDTAELMIGSQITALTLLNTNLNAQLANLSPGNTSVNNRLVGSIRANQGKIQLLQTSLTQQKKNVRVARVRRNDARETYIQAILDLRQLVDSISAKYEELASSDKARAAVEQLNQVTGKEFELVESSGFHRAVSRLKQLEKTVLSESIPLRRVGGGSLMVNVVFGKEHTQEMVLDSGANLISLPKAIASKCGIEVGPNDTPLVLSLADGSRITGHLVNIPLVRVGKFTAENVRCAVLSDEAIHAPPLLGMSFLGRFKFEIDAAKGTLTMVKVTEN